MQVNDLAIAELQDNTALHEADAMYQAPREASGAEGPASERLTRELYWFAEG